ncbi:uncharacterized [Tachysurus ichikawai]
MAKLSSSVSDGGESWSPQPIRLSYTHLFIRLLIRDLKLGHRERRKTSPPANSANLLLRKGDGGKKLKGSWRLLRGSEQPLDYVHYHHGAHHSGRYSASTLFQQGQTVLGLYVRCVKSVSSVLDVKAAHGRQRLKDLVNIHAHSRSTRVISANQGILRMRKQPSDGLASRLSGSHADVITCHGKERLAVPATALSLKHLSMRQVTSRESA